MYDGANKLEQISKNQWLKTSAKSYAEHFVIIMSKQLEARRSGTLIHTENVIARSWRYVQMKIQCKLYHICVCTREWNESCVRMEKVPCVCVWGLLMKVATLQKSCIYYGNGDIVIKSQDVNTNEPPAMKIYAVAVCVPMFWQTLHILSIKNCSYKVNAYFPS